MLIFTIIIFGLATLRTIVPLAKEENWNGSTIIIAITMVIAYIWFLNQFIIIR